MEAATPRERFPVREHKLPHVGKSFTPLMLRIAAFYVGVLRVLGERAMKHAINPVVHLRVHLSESRNSRRKRNLSARHCDFWARPKHRSGLERPRLSQGSAPKHRPELVPALRCAQKVS